MYNVLDCLEFELIEVLLCNGSPKFSTTSRVFPLTNTSLLCAADDAFLDAGAHGGECQ